MGCLLAYFVVMSDYGFRPINLFFFSFKKGIRPAAQDYFNEYDPEYNGNSRAFIQENKELLGLYGEAQKIYIDSNIMELDWDGDSMASIDLRLFYPYLPRSFFGKCKHNSRGQNYDDFVCYRVEALRHAQGAYFLAVVTMQIANAFNWRTKISSVFKHKMDNYRLHIAFLFEYGLVMLILFCPGLNTAFGTRPIRAEHFFPCLGMFIIFFFVGETFKFLIRHSQKPDGTPGFFNEYFNY